MAFAHALFHRLVEVFREQCGATVEESGQRSHEGADEADGHDAFHACGQDVLHHHGEGTVRVMGVGDVHDNAATSFLGKRESDHAGNQEHENRKELEVTGGNATATGAFHDHFITFAFGLPEYTLYDVLVCAPIPEADDGSTEEYYIARELRIHRVVRVGVEHVGRSETVVCGITYGHHFRPARSDTSIAQHVQSQEQHEERTYDEDRRLDGRQGHHAFHAAEHCEHCRDGNQADGTIPKWQPKQVFEEDTARECGYGNLGQHIGNQCDDGQP